jgi:hypothetical protein
MNEYEQIMKQAKEQGLDFDGKDIIIHITENKLMFNGEMRFGRVFDLAAYVFRDVEEPLSETGSVSEPFIYRIVDRYDTWVSNGAMLYRIDFYVVE